MTIEYLSVHTTEDPPKYTELLLSGEEVEINSHETLPYIVKGVVVGVNMKEKLVHGLAGYTTPRCVPWGYDITYRVTEKKLYGG